MARKLPTIVVVLLVASVGLAARVGVAPARAATGDSVVLAWNQQLLDTIAATRTAPTIAARALAIVHTAVYDAWAAYDPVAVGTRLGGGLRRPPAERTLDNKNEAVSFAAYAALVDLFPARQLTYAQQMADLGYAVDGSDTSMAAGVGTVAAGAVLDYRHHDGANQLGDLNGGAPYSDDTGYSSRRWPATTTRPAGSCCGRACSPPPLVDARDRSPRSASQGSGTTPLRPRPDGIASTAPSAATGRKLAALTPLRPSAIPGAGCSSFGARLRRHSDDLPAPYHRVEVREYGRDTRRLLLRGGDR